MTSKPLTKPPAALPGAAVTGDEVESSSMSLIEHLTELRNRILWSLLAFVVAMLACFAVWEPIYDFLTVPLCSALRANGQDCELVFLSVQEGFFLAFQISMAAGLALAFPVIGYQMWRFVAPGLYRNERAAFLPFLVASPAMFVAGAAFAYYVVLPMAFGFMLSFQKGDLTDLATVDGPEPATGAVSSIVFQGSAQSYLSLTISFVLAFGLCFQLPVLLTLMGRAGIVTSAALGRTRKYAVVAILILAAVATPPDMMSQLILFCAVYPLYEASIFLVRRHERAVEARMRAEGTLAEGETIYGDEADGSDEPGTKA